MIENSTYAKYKSSNNSSCDYIRIKGIGNMKLESIYGFLRTICGDDVEQVEIITKSEYDREHQ